MDDSLNRRITLLEKTLDICEDKLDKSMSNSGLGGVGSVRSGNAVLPNKTAKPKMSNNSKSSKIKIPSVGQPSKKDPLKSIQQTHNKDVKDIKMKEALANVPNLQKSNGAHDDHQVKALIKLHSQIDDADMKREIQKAIEDRIKEISPAKPAAPEQSAQKKSPVDQVRAEIDKIKNQMSGQVSKPKDFEDPNGFITVKGPKDRSPRRIMVQPGPKGETPEQRDKRLAAESKAKQEKRQSDEIARRLMDPKSDFREKALQYSAPQIQEANQKIQERKIKEMMDRVGQEKQKKEEDEMWSNWENELDPRMVGGSGQGSKKRNAARMNVLEQRKERPHRLAEQAFEADPTVKEGFKPDPSAQPDEEGEAPPMFAAGSPRKDDLGKVNNKLDFLEELVKSGSLKNKPFATGKTGRKMYVLKQKIKAIKELKEKDPETAKKIPASSPQMRKSRCWEGYEPVPGKKAYEKGSCRPKGSKKKACKCKGKGCDCK